MSGEDEWRLMPMEATAEMNIAGAHVCDQRPSEVAAIYRAMTAAAPAPSEAPKPESVSSRRDFATTLLSYVTVGNWSVDDVVKYLTVYIEEFDAMQARNGAAR
jgi:hypothetical protein